jgi:hypothetical protein
MSGNAALSAAKRRRGQTMNQVISQAPPPVAKTLTAEQMLMKHDAQLQRIEQRVPEIVEKLEAEMKTMVEGGVGSGSSAPQLDVDAVTQDMGYMGSRLQQIEEQLEGLNKSIIQMQSFTMEMKTHMDSLDAKETSDANVGQHVEVEDEEVQVDGEGKEGEEGEEGEEGDDAEEEAEPQKKKRGRPSKKNNIVMEVEAELQG